MSVGLKKLSRDVGVDSPATKVLSVCMCVFPATKSLMTTLNEMSNAYNACRNDQSREKCRRGVGVPPNCWVFDDLHSALIKLYTMYMSSGYKSDKVKITWTLY